MLACPPAVYFLDVLPESTMQPELTSGSPGAVPARGAVMSLLSIKALTKRFGGLVAVKSVSFDVEAGSIVGLIGPNGAGKTTVFNLITGIYRPDEGQIQFQGDSIAGMSTHLIVARGIARPSRQFGSSKTFRCWKMF